LHEHALGRRTGVSDAGKLVDLELAPTVSSIGAAFGAVHIETLEPL
jgi:hypothetical protein